ncbi:hypothetical protein AAC80_004239 [Salmonella enterica subsp. enterica]|nr:hypothetical protein [Salmonella enterica subsp. enterica]EDY0620347.1 hypothetical protein [Salmonella enterica subsp. enterica]
MVSPLVRSRYVNSVGLHPCNPAIFHVAQSGEVLVPFSPPPASETTEKTRRAVCTEFPLSGYIP